MAAPSCPLCGSSAIKTDGLYRSVHPAFTGLKRARCHSCDMVFAAPMPGDETLREYNAQYFESAHGGEARTASATAFFSGIARLRLAQVERYLAAQNIIVSRVLEWGPGRGFFARCWLEKHPGTRYMAVETDAACHASLVEIGVEVLEVPAKEESVDLIVMSHVLEHVPDPIAFLTDARENLRRDGAVFIEVPCRDWEHKPVDEPHLLFFEKATMHRLLTRVGFRGIEVSYNGQEIDRLRSRGMVRAKWLALRSKLIAAGLVVPFARTRPGMEMLADPLERAVVAPFNAHRESGKPAWWLRALARRSG